MLLRGVRHGKQRGEALLPQLRGLALWDEGSPMLQVVEMGRGGAGISAWLLFDNQMEATNRTSNLPPVF